MNTALRKLRQTVTFALALTACVAAFKASAAITCNVAVTSISTVYDPTVATENLTTGNYTVSCTRLGTDPNTLNYTLGANDGLQPTGITNRVQLGANRYSYEIYRLSPYNVFNSWEDFLAFLRFAGTVNFGASLAASHSAPFTLRVAGSQPVVPAGTYTDIVTATLRSGAVILNTTTFGVSVITTNSCQISVPPGNVSFAYTSFQLAAAAASTSFGARCTSALPYTMALDATSGTLLGLNYTLALSAAGGTGTGITQTYSVNGSIAGGQAGTCAVASCVGSQTRTLTVSW